MFHLGRSDYKWDVGEHEFLNIRRILSCNSYSNSHENHPWSDLVSAPYNGCSGRVDIGFANVSIYCMRYRFFSLILHLWQGSYYAHKRAKCWIRINVCHPYYKGLISFDIDSIAICCTNSLLCFVFTDYGGTACPYHRCDSKKHKSLMGWNKE